MAGREAWRRPVSQRGHVPPSRPDPVFPAAVPPFPPHRVLLSTRSSRPLPGHLLPTLQVSAPGCLLEEASDFPPGPLSSPCTEAVAFLSGLSALLESCIWTVTTFALGDCDNVTVEISPCSFHFHICSLCRTSTAYSGTRLMGR